MPGPRRPQQIALLLGLLGRALEEGQRLRTFAAIDGLDDLGAIERVLAWRRLFLGGLLARGRLLFLGSLARPALVLAEPALRLGRRGQGDEQDHAGQQALEERPRAALRIHVTPILTDSVLLALAPAHL